MLPHGLKVFFIGLLTAITSVSAQPVSTHIASLENARNEAEFNVLFSTMIDSIHAGKLPLQAEQVLDIIEIAKEKPFADQVLANVYGWAATTFGDGRMDKAIIYFMESAAFYKKQNKRLAEAIGYFEIALVQHKAENYGEAEEYYKKALVTAADSMQHRTLINCYNGLALIHRHRENYDSAIRGFRKAYQFAKAHTDTAWLGILAGNIGSCHLAKGDYDSSLLYYHDNLRFIRKTNEFENEIETYTNLGRVYLKKEQYSISKLYLDSAVNIIHDRQIALSDFFNPMDHIFEAYSELYAATGDFSRAYEYHVKFHNAAEYKQEKINGRSLKQLQSIYAFNEKQNEVTYLKAINDANMVVIRQQKYISSYFAAIIVLLCCFVTLIIMRARQRKKLNTELAASNQELERLNNIKDKLFSVISHDLRGPIANLRSMLVLIRAGQLGQQEFNMIAAGLSEQLEISGNALENLLQWAKTQLHEIKANPVDIRIYDLANNVLQQFNHELQGKRINIRTEIQSDLQVRADKDQLEVIVRNLISNSIKFTPRNGTITIAGTRIDDKVALHIQDTGIGMTEAQLNNLFMPGKHFTSSGTNNEKGTGIGLLITKEMVINNGGEISVESRRGEGTKFTCELPVPA